MKRTIYDGVKISEKVLTAGIFTGLALMLVLIVGASMTGFTVTYKSGDTRLAEEHVRYGEHLSAPTEPVRDGYIFDGWYTSPAGGTKYDFEKGTAKDDITLYASWRQKDSAAAMKTAE